MAQANLAQRSRPLSPHLQIYRWYFTMAMSVVHRGTGIATTVGLLALTWGLVALASGPDAFATFQAALDNFLGLLVLLGFLLAFFLHATTGVRHFFWDIGIGVENAIATQTGVMALGAGILLTLAAFVAVLILR
jgi:succinate dehydrogenase / fumarate reductase cytochrome b subunit